MEKYLEEINRLARGESDLTLDAALSEGAWHQPYEVQLISVDEDDIPDRVYVQTDVPTDFGSWTAVIDIDHGRFDGKSDEELVAFAKADFDGAMAARPTPSA